MADSRSSSGEGTAADIKDEGCVDNLVSGVTNGSIFESLAARD